MVRKRRIKDFSTFQILANLLMLNIFESNHISSEKDFEQRRSHFFEVLGVVQRILREKCSDKAQLLRNEAYVGLRRSDEGCSATLFRSPSAFIDIPVAHTDNIILFGKVCQQLIGHDHGPVLSAGATQSDIESRLAFLFV
jgi:hypothetical protein